jgi:hypothetical protein
MMKCTGLHRILLLFLGCLFLLNTAYSQRWIASPQVTVGETGGKTISGYVFHDTNRNGILDKGEKGILDVLVSNGFGWVRTDEKGYYEIPVRKDMNLTIV